MMKHEFEKIAGYEVSQKDYSEIIEPMYMSTDLNKEEFVKVINKERFALKTREEIITDMKKIAYHLKESCIHYTDHEALENLSHIAREYTERFYYNSYMYTISYEYFHGTSCDYPIEIQIYNRDCDTIETIKLV